MRVLLINNYSMERAYALWKQGTSGSHHVWGKVELDERKNVEIIILQHEKYKFLNRLGNIFKIGHLDQQLRTLAILKSVDIIYSPYSTANTKLLLFLKLIGLLKKPIVVTVHQPILGAKSNNIAIKSFAKKYFLKYDACIFLSRKLMHNMIEVFEISQKEKDQRFFSSEWGPDTNFYQKYSEPKLPHLCPYVISAGHTDRDYETLIEAFRGINFQLRIFCTPKSVPKTKDIPENVIIVSETLPYEEILKHYVYARIIAIPLKYPASKEGCQGMTSLQDVIALGKPVIMTENKSLNMQVEKEGIGYCVGQGDVGGWRNALNDLIFDEEKLIDMSGKALALHRFKYNSRIFANDLEKVLMEVHTRKKTLS
ncbi:MAG: glycosyltransferase [Anditalea sp.]